MNILYACIIGLVCFLMGYGFCALMHNMIMTKKRIRETAEEYVKQHAKNMDMFFDSENNPYSVSFTYYDVINAFCKGAEI